ILRVVPIRPMAAELTVEPRPGVIPVASGCCARDAEGLGGLLDGQAGEVAELDQLGLGGGFASEARPPPGEGGHGVRRGTRGGGGSLDVLEMDPAQAASVLLGLLAAGVLDEDPPHGRGGGGEEVIAATPAPRGWARTDEPDVGLVHERRSLEGLAGLLLCEP